VTPGVEGVGPVAIDRKRCLVLLADATVGHPSTVTAKVDGTDITVTLDVRETSLAVQLFYGGPLRGGDEARNVASIYGGTIAFAGSPTIEGTHRPKVAVSCSHVLAISTNNQILSPLFGVCMDLLYAYPVPYGGQWVDLAFATIRVGTVHKDNTIKGLGELQGVRQPTFRSKVYKYGLGTGLTSGRDLGMVWRKLGGSADPNLYLVRTVSGNFSGFGDSGAAIVDKDRNFLGLVVAGIPAIKGERYYISALPEGEDRVDRDLSAFHIKLT
jgi:hypothetical protein